MTKEQIKTPTVFVHIIDSKFNIAKITTLGLSKPCLMKYSCIRHYSRIR